MLAPLLSSILIVALLVMLVSYDRQPRLGKLILDQQLVPESRIVIAKSWLNRRAGLLNHASLGRRDGLWLSGTACVHTHGMAFAIDIVFVAADAKVIAIVPSVPPE